MDAEIVRRGELEQARACEALAFVREFGMAAAQDVEGGDANDEQFAARIRKVAADNPEVAVETGWRIAFGRPPSNEERQTALDYLKRSSLKRLCLLILNMNEFIYVD